MIPIYNWYTYNAGEQCIRHYSHPDRIKVDDIIIFINHIEKVNIAVCTSFNRCKVAI